MNNIVESKKHFRAIAEIIKKHTVTVETNEGTNNVLLISTIYALADYFATDNADFDRQRFVTACLE
jgi:hypothetical protein